MIIHNSEEYRTAFQWAHDRAMDGFLFYAFQDLRRFTDKNLYGAHSPSSYERTYQIKDAWRTVKGGLDGAIFFDESRLSVNENLDQHTTFLGKVIETLEAGYYPYGNKKAPKIPARPFFTMWKATRANRYAGAWYRKGLVGIGLKVLGR